MKDLISILGGGPAGSSAALAALGEGAAVRIIEKSRFPRHKVCGEFFSPEIVPELERLGVWGAFADRGPARVENLILHFGAKSKKTALPEAALGLSRFAFDALLLDRAAALGAEVAKEIEAPARIIATGRKALAFEARGRRLFGFKAHFEGTPSDAIELFFFDGCYVGVTAIESGRTNICGLGPESFLSRFDFELDAVVARCPELADRIKPLRRTMPWISTGPLQYGQRLSTPSSQYETGDALSFVDPFTGSGLLAAVRSGAMAGRACVRKEPVTQYLKGCRKSLRQPFQIAGILRKLLAGGWAEKLAPIAPARVLFALTRPR